MSESVDIKIGVYVCHCGGNISDNVDVEAVRSFSEGLLDVVVARCLEHTCSDEGQNIIKEDILEYNLNRIVVGTCSPQFHERTFQETLKDTGLNPYLLEVANLREQCSWIYEDRDSATRKAKNLMKIAASKVRLNEPLEIKTVPIGNSVLVIGAGIAGIQASLDLADSGMNVYTVERSPSVGGHMAQLSRSFPTDDCSACILDPKKSDLFRHPNVTLYSYSEVNEVNGHIANFDIGIVKKPRYVDENKCTACKVCEEVCPISVLNKFEVGIGTRKCAYMYPESVPALSTIDIENCIRCGLCKLVCEADAIDFSQKPEDVNIRVDTIIAATGYDFYPAEELRYGYGMYENVMIGPQLERMNVTTGPTGGKLIRLSDGEPIRRIAFIQCVGARDKQIGMPNCSRVCCMYALKHVQWIKKKNPGAEVYMFYKDIRAFGKGFEGYYERAQDAGVVFIKGGVSEIIENEDKTLTLRGEDTLTGDLIEVECDVVCLSVGFVPDESTRKVAELLGVATDDDGYFLEAHPKYRPVDTLRDGIFICGCASGPKDIPDSVAQASASAARAIRLMNQGQIALDPIKAFVRMNCDGCGVCLEVCPNGAIGMIEDNVLINEAICQGCGLCISSCKKGAISIKNFTEEQIMSQVEAVLSEGDEKKIIAFLDDGTTYRIADRIGQAGFSYPENVYIIRVKDGSQITPEMIVKTFELGASGVFIGEPEGGSTVFNPKSVEVAKKNIEEAKVMLSDRGIDPNRLSFGLYITVWAQRLAGQLNDLAEICED
ncbi:MAG: 4Fe-4S binding protein [Halobacteriota archaeon]|nr:4Fe-4S binding protein [Halobacteriota archaeon]